MLVPLDKMLSQAKENSDNMKTCKMEEYQARSTDLQCPPGCVVYRTEMAFIAFFRFRMERNGKSSVV